MEAVVVSAPGKIILAGEHAVVYGYPAIVAAIDRHLTVKVIRKPSKQKFSGLVKFALDQLGQTNKVDLDIQSDLPVGSGLGSSAALATAMVWALLPQAKLEEKNRLVKIIEDHQHGKSSGVDQTIVREGGCLRFQKGTFQAANLPLKQAILIDSGRPKESTKDMVTAVAGKKLIFPIIGRLATDWSEKLIKENERLLEELGVVGEPAKKIIRQVEASGGMAKICGAGGVKAGSGMVLAVHPDQDRLQQLISRNQWPYLRVKLGGGGVRYETD
ncbi:MAG: hypothetical protein Q8P47_01355 [Candidatus Beckwithbacteria bacterium]|nr:hypothetical protein [Candidatus Beckwithbacteria bacterium]